ncbi:MAG TPA: serine/threonine-protein kinase [Syntrophales bacterium]|nr:serine/threonine-protein kinase [Syntrophales bacterium]
MVVENGAKMDNALSLPADYVLNNRYTIGKVIGVGGFGIVYIAWDNNLDIKVAVKEFLPKEYAARSSDHVSIIPCTGSTHEDLSLSVEKFLEEAKALAHFQDHPGIVTVHESFRANNTAYMVMQYLDGMTLKEYLKGKPGEKIAFTKAVEVMTPIMDALRGVHNAGFVHRDISPDNIFLTYQKQVKLLDFGSARYAIGKHSKSMTTVLKNGYAPPEQYSAKGRQGPWSDVYAVCATIYRCVTGFDPPDAMDRIQVDTIKSPIQLGIDIPLSGERALMRGLALNASDRFENIQQLQQALTEIPVIIECPKCGAKNQLPPGNDQNAMRCWRCRTKLGRTKGFRSPDDTPWIYLSLFVLVFIIIVIMVGIFLELPPQPPPPTRTTAPAPAPYFLKP